MHFDLLIYCLETIKPMFDPPVVDPPVIDPPVVDPSVVDPCEMKNCKFYEECRVLNDRASCDGEHKYKYLVSTLLCTSMHIMSKKRNEYVQTPDSHASICRVCYVFDYELKNKSKLQKISIDHFIIYLTTGFFLGNVPFR